MRKSIYAFGCFLIILSGCATTASRDFFTTRHDLDMPAFDRGYEEGIALAKTEGMFSTDKDLPAFMEKILENEPLSYQKGVLAGYRDQKAANARRFTTVYWGSWAVFVAGLMLSELVSEE